LAQRVAMRCRLRPLQESDTVAYVQHRIRLAGSPKEVFHPDALAEVHRWSGGVPRVINTLCDNMLMELFFGQERTATPERVAEVAENLGLLLHGEGEPELEEPERPEELPAVTGGPGADAIAVVERADAVADLDPERLAAQVAGELMGDASFAMGDDASVDGPTDLSADVATDEPAEVPGVPVSPVPESLIEPVAVADVAAPKVPPVAVADVAAPKAPPPPVADAAQQVRDPAVVAAPAMHVAVTTPVALVAAPQLVAPAPTAAVDEGVDIDFEIDAGEESAAEPPPVAATAAAEAEEAPITRDLGRGDGPTESPPGVGLPGEVPAVPAAELDLADLVMGADLGGAARGEGDGDDGGFEVVLDDAAGPPDPGAPASLPPATLTPAAEAEVQPMARRRIQTSTGKVIDLGEIDDLLADLD